MKLQNDFQERTDDIEAYFSLLKFVDSIEAYKNIPIAYGRETLSVTSDMQKCLRANAILLLYNIVESTINNCIWRIYDAIHDNQTTYDRLSTALKKIWLKKEYKENQTLPNIRNKTFNLIKDHTHKTIQFEQIVDSISGNLDLRKIEQIFIEYDCPINFSYDKEKVSKYLLYTKACRNSLAHGNTSFSQKGSMLLVSELIEAKDQLINFLSSLINRVEDFVIQKKYLA